MTIGRDFTRIIDLISLKILKWPNQSQTRRDFEVIPLVPDQGQAYEKSINARGVLLEQVTNDQSSLRLHNDLLTSWQK